MNDIRSEMIEAGFGAGCGQDLSRIFAVELRRFADPDDAVILTGWIEKTRNDFVKVSTATANALQAVPKSNDAPHVFRQLGEALLEFALTRCEHPSGMSQAVWHDKVLDASTKLQRCTDGILAGDRQAYADLKSVADFLRRHFKDFEA